MSVFEIGHLEMRCAQNRQRWRDRFAVRYFVFRADDSWAGHSVNRCSCPKRPLFGSSRVTTRVS